MTSSKKKRFQEVEPEVITSKKRSKVDEDTDDNETEGHDHEKFSSLEERNSPTVMGDDESKPPDECSSSSTGGFDSATNLSPIPEKESPDDVLARLLSQTSSNEPGRGNENADIPFNFPERLMDLLEKQVAKDAMWFLSEGDAFAIVPKLFSEQVLDKFFQGTKFESFTRKLNRWGFKRITGQKVPRHAVAYFHHMFQRGKPCLLKKMSGGKKKEPDLHDKLIRNQLYSDLHHASHDPRVGSANSLPSASLSMDIVAGMNKLRAENSLLRARLAEQSRLPQAAPDVATEVLLRSLADSQRDADQALRRQAELLALASKQQQKTALMSHLCSPVASDITSGLFPGVAGSGFAVVPVAPLPPLLLNSPLQNVDPAIQHLLKKQIQK